MVALSASVALAPLLAKPGPGHERTFDWVIDSGRLITRFGDALRCFVWAQ